MSTLLLFGIPLMVAAAILLAFAGNWLTVTLLTVFLLGILWLVAHENHWPQRLRISHLKWRLRHLRHTMDKTSDEMVQLWHDDPGCDEWQALDSWLAELFIERRQLTLHIEDLVYRLGRETY